VIFGDLVSLEVEHLVADFFCQLHAVLLVRDVGIVSHFATRAADDRDLAEKEHFPPL
jgi:hypothetical protein